MNDRMDELMEKMLTQGSLEPVRLCAADGAERVYKPISMIRLEQGNYVIMEPLDETGETENAEEKIVEIFRVEMRQDGEIGFLLEEEADIIDTVIEQYYQEYEDLWRKMGII